ncbi:MAG: tetratricopeptide repeat protein [Cyclobacteriaceae bacterium]
MNLSTQSIFLSVLCLLFLGCSHSLFGTDFSTQPELLKAEQFLTTDLDSAFYYAKRAESLGQERNDSELLANSYLILGQLFFKEAAFNQSLEYFLKAEREAEETLNRKLQAKNANLLGLNYYYLRNPKYTINYHLQALKIFTELTDSVELAKTYGYLGHYFEKNHQYDSAFFYQQKALSLYENMRDHDPKDRILILENIGSIYEDLEIYDSASLYFNYALQQAVLHGQENVKMSILNNLGDVLYKTGKFKEAFPYMEEGLSLAKKFDDSYQLLSHYKDLSKLYYRLNNHKIAYDYLDSSVLFYKKIYSEDGLRQVSRLQTFYEAERKDREIGILSRDQRISQLRLFLSLGGIVTILLVAGGLFYHQRFRMRENKRIYEARGEMMEEQLESKSRSLAAHTLQLIQKNSLLEEIHGEVKAIYQQENKSFKKQLKELHKKIENNLSHERDWDNFKMIFEEVHTSFFDNLRKVNPDLSKSELKLAVLIKLQLSSNDIATMLSISQDSLRIARYRLRKKIGLRKEQKLSAFIQSL